LAINFKPDELVRNDGNGVFILTTREQRRRMYTFGPLFSLANLKEVVLKCKVYENPYYQKGTGWTIYLSRLRTVRCWNELFEMVKEGFRKHGKSMKVRIRISGNDFKTLTKVDTV
jgi:hypothetical protein